MATLRLRLCAQEGPLAAATRPLRRAAGGLLHHTLRAASTCPCPTCCLPAALLDQGELGAHSADKAEAWLAAVPPLFPRLGLQLAAHSARLMPLLLGWALAPWPAVRAAALRALLGVLRLTWPRAGAHAVLTWRVLRRVHDEERLRRRWARRCMCRSCPIKLARKVNT